MATRAPVLLAVAYVLLGSAWLVGNPPGAAPDEYAHYLKALAAGRGELLLDHRPPRPVLESVDEAVPWHAVTSRLVRVPAGLDPTPLLCSAFRPGVTAGCLHRDSSQEATEAATIVGPYQPFTYVVPGILMRWARDPESATRLGRLGFWLASAVLLAVAVYLLWSPDNGGYSLLGLLVGITPMVAFMVSTLSANGVEIAAGICFSSALLRLARRDPAVIKWPWAAMAGSGAVLALSRVTGVLWLSLSLLSVAALLGWRPAAAAVRRQGGRAAAAAVVVATAVVASVAWELAVQPHPHRSVGAAVRGLRGEIAELPQILDQAIGVFGWIDTRMPMAAYTAWKVLLVAVIVLAIVVGDRRQRAVLCSLAVASVGVTLAVATLNRATGFGAQARYVLPFVTILPLVAGEIVAANRRRLPGLLRLALPWALAVPVATLHLLAWYTNARRYAVGLPGPWAFVGPAEWSPPLGWVTWISVVSVAAAALVLAVVAPVPSSVWTGKAARRQDRDLV